MVRVHVICEGQAEEMFVNEVLSASFLGRGIHLRPSLVGKPGHKGGTIRLQRLLADVRNRLLNDTTAYCTTFFDYYGLPGSFPGRVDAGKQTATKQRAGCIVDALTKSLGESISEEHLRRFIPYVQMHEFEGLLFSNVSAFARSIDQIELAQNLERIRNAFESPEDINDGAATAPSKRITRLLPTYEKPLNGSLAAIEIGLDTIRKECPLFNAWLSRIEALAESVDV